MGVIFTIIITIVVIVYFKCYRAAKYSAALAFLATLYIRNTISLDFDTFLTFYMSFCTIASIYFIGYYGLVQDTENKIQKLNDTICNLNKELTILKNNIPKYENEANRRNQIIANLDNNLRQTKIEVNRQNQIIIKLNNDLHQIENKADKQNQIIAKLNSSLDQAKIDIEKKDHILYQDKLIFRKKDEQICDLETKYVLELRQKNEKISSLNEEIDLLNNEKQELICILNELKKRM